MNYRTPRFHFLDALRGLAAASVVLHHIFFSSVMVTVYQAASPYFLRVLFQTGANGVEIFFVLSGFVIAHSLRNNSLAPVDVGRFIVRRQVRLDPPYWAALVLGLVWLWLRNHLPGVVRSPLPSPGELALNATYLHGILRLPSEAIVLEVAWTLCLEIQFYVLFIAILWLCHDTPRVRPSDNSGDASPAISNRALTLMWASALVCLVVRYFVVDAAYFWTAWHYFVAGTLAYWAVTRKASSFWVASLLGAFVLSWCGSVIPALAAWLPHPVYRGQTMHSGDPLALFVGATTTLALWQLGLRQQLGIWNNVRPLQYLGRISYSLYLTHMMVLLMVLRLGYKITKNNVAAAFMWMVVCSALCVLVAHAFYWLIERPSLRWASALSKREPGPEHQMSADDKARALSRISSNSSSGTESTTIPPPA